MNLSDWLCEGAPKVTSSLVKMNEELAMDSKFLSYTTRDQIIDILKSLRALILPGIYERTPMGHMMLSTVAQSKIKHVAIDFCEIIEGVLDQNCGETREGELCADDITIDILEGMPLVREVLQTDIVAAYEGDPAAKSLEEIIMSYPSLEAISVYRIAHLIHGFGVPIIPRIMTEYAHKVTGIDIHPGATIGKSFFIDHGTGVVIGETCTIGDGVKLYQGVTLGAKSFPLDEHGNPIKGIKRHPDLQDNVVVYAGATILGGETVIGHDSLIGGNVWLTHSVPPHSTVFNAQPAPTIRNMNGD
jgi:serine O-acetyltransferase